LHCIPQILYAESLNTGLIICVKSFFSYNLHVSHGTSVTDRRTDTSRAINAIAVARQNPEDFIE